MSETNIFYERSSYWTDKTNIGTIIVKLQFYRDGQNTDHQSKDYPKETTLKWTTPKHNIPNEYYLMFLAASIINYYT